jgi:hypothetical protein
VNSYEAEALGVQRVGRIGSADGCSLKTFGNRRNNGQLALLGHPSDELGVCLAARVRGQVVPHADQCELNAGGCGAEDLIARDRQESGFA